MQHNGSAHPSETNRIWGFSSAGRIFFGWGALGELQNVGKEFGKRVLICTDVNIAKSGIVGRVETILKEAGCEVEIFDGGVPEVDLGTIDIALEKARAFGPDLLVAVGGGSNLDLCKCVGVLLKYPAPLSQYYGENMVPGPIVDLIAIPTTSGTGSEVSPVAVVSDPNRAMKVGIASRYIIPNWAIVDPELTVSCPATVTSHSGIDALVHAIEAYCAILPEGRSPYAVFVGKNPVSDALARESIQLIAGSLEKAVHEPKNRAARYDMALGSLLAGLAFSNAGTAAIHALQYPVGEATHTSHGLGNAVLMPAVLRAITPARIPELAYVARILDPGLSNASDADAANAAPELVAKLGDKIGIPRGLGAIGLAREKLPEMAELASGVKRLIDNSPVKFDQASLLAILEEAY